MDIHFRQANPHDVEDAYSLIYSSGPDIIDYLFGVPGKKSTDYIRYAFQDEKGLFGSANHTVAVVDNKVVGIGAFYSGNEYFKLSTDHTIQIFKFFGFIQGMNVLKKCLQIQKIIPPPNKKTVYVADFGVKESFRGKGMGTALLTHQKNKAIQNKKSFYSLDVSPQNPRAQKLYEKFGFWVVGEKSVCVDGNKPIKLGSKRMMLEI